MKVYLAGAAPRLSSNIYQFKYEGLHHLETYEKKPMIIKLFEKRPEISIMLDSGAFTAWTQGKPVDLDEYIAFIKEYKDRLDCYINLDVIPGKPGQHSLSKEEVTEAAEQGWENWLYMKKHGLDPVPVFHQGEDIEFLKRMIEETDYVGISPQEDLREATKDQWLRQVFKFLDDYPDVKTHGFGVTNVNFLHRFKWYSADSITWRLLGAYGKILYPRNGYEYDRTPWVVPISDDSGEVGKTDMHFDSMAPVYQEAFYKYIADAGFTVAEMKEAHWPRTDINVKYFMDLEENLQEKEKDEMRRRSFDFDNILR
jgi:hypothetical protein